MTLLIFDATQQTWIVIIALAIAFFATLKPRFDSGLSLKVTADLKGLAIFFVVLSHIGYFLVTDHRFLVPLSNFAGVGVDLFLLLSGFGLVVAAYKKDLSPWQFYKRRLSKVYIPALVTIIILLIADWLVLNKTYPITLTIKNILGFFPQADLYNDLNSPLWFITPLLAYYLLFPFLFWKKHPLVSALVFAALGWLAVRQGLPATIGGTWGVAGLYKLHFLAFPIGMAFSALFNQPPLFLKKISNHLKTTNPTVISNPPSEGVRNLVRNDKPTLDSSSARASLGMTKHWPWMAGTLRYLAIIAIVLVLSNTLTDTRVGAGWKIEQAVSIITAICFTLLFVLVKLESKLLYLFGFFSYEIYLMHWPILYRYDFMYDKLPAGMATIFYLALFVIIAYIFRFVNQTITRRLSS